MKKRKEAIRMFEAVFLGEPCVLMTFQPPQIGVFDSPEALDSVLKRKSIQKAYVVLNKTSDEALEKLPSNRLTKMTKGLGIRNEDITEYRFFFIDIDVVGLREENGEKQNASDIQHDCAREVSRQVKEYLEGLGFPDPVVIDSANGFHVLYKLSLSVTPEHKKLIKKAVCALAEKLDTAECKIDTVVADPGRKIKIPGSVNQADQKFIRYSFIEELPEKLTDVTEEQLELLVSDGTGESDGWKCSPESESEKDDIVDVAETIGEYFTSDSGQTFANVRIDDEKVVTMNIMSNQFRLVVRRALKEAVKVRTLSSDMWKSLLDYLEVVASENKVTKKIYNRIGKSGEAIYYDLEDDDYQSVMITEKGWEIIPTPPGIFQRVDLDKPQVVPEYDEEFDYFGTLEELFNLSNRREVELLGIWLISCFIPDIAKPLVLFSGAHATGKSTACSMLQDLISPQTMERSSFPRRIDDLVVRLCNRCLCSWDNCEKISAEASAILCQCITGGNYEKRKLYTDATLISIPLKSMVLMNSCESILEKPDILSRTLQFNLSSMDGRKMRDDNSMKALFEEKKPYLLGYILLCVSGVLGIRNDSQCVAEIRYVTRMTEFQRVATQIATACFGKDATYVEELLTENKRRIDMDVLESNPVAVLITEFMKRRTRWEGSVTDLYDQIDQLAFEQGIERSNKLYPKHAASLSMRLNSMVEILENAGITFNIRPEGKYKKIYIKNNGKQEVFGSKRRRK